MITLLLALTTSDILYMTIEPYQLSKGTILFLPLMIFVTIPYRNHIVCSCLLCPLKCYNYCRTVFTLLCLPSEAQQTVNRWMEFKRIKTTTAGFEPARAKPNRFLVCLLNHSDKLSRKVVIFCLFEIKFVTNNLTNPKTITYYSNHFSRNSTSCCANGRRNGWTGMLIWLRKFFHIGKHKHGYHCLSNMEWSSYY